MSTGERKHSDSMDLLELRTLGKFHIHKPLGAGGMGAVFLATDSDLKRTVALKVLPRDRAENPTLVRRFKSEAQAVAQLKHENIVSIFEAGEIDGYPYLALEYVEGTDLHTLVKKRGVLPPKRSLHIIRQVADALAHLHERNIVHRDIKPSNLLVKTDGSVKLTDMGLARSVDETLATDITRAGMTVGTIDYISPEQACDSKAADIRSDIYSLGCTWYHLLTGSAPFAVGDMKNKLQSHLNAPPPDPRHLNSNVPDGYVAVIHQMMAKRPQDRYQTPADLLADLDKVAGAVSSLQAEMFDGAPSATASPSGSSTATRSRGPREAGDVELGEPSQKMKVRKSEGKPPRVKSGRRGSGQPSEEADDLEAGEAVETKGHKSRKLPERDRGKKPEGWAINIDFLRFGVVGLLVVGVLGLFWWAMSRDGGPGGGGKGGQAAGTGGQQVNPDDLATDAVDPQNPGGQPAPPGTAGASAPPSNVVAGLPRAVDRSGSFPGFGDLPDLNSPLAKQWLPDWVFAIRSDSPAGLRRIQVRSDGENSSTIAQAIRQLNGESGVIELIGDGIFPLAPIDAGKVGRLVIRAADKSQPLVVQSGNLPPDQPKAHLQLSSGLLELEGLHLLIPASQPVSGRAVFGVQDGTLRMNRCTLTVESGGPAVTLCDLRNEADSKQAARLLIENSLLRGGQLTAIRAHGPQIDLILGGTAIVSSSGALLDVALKSSAVDTPAADASAPTASTTAGDSSPAVAPAGADSFVRVYGSSLLSGGSILRTRPSGAAAGDPLKLQVRNSQLTRVASDGEAGPLLDGDGWTAASSITKSTGLEPQLLKVAISGWEQLARLGPGGTSRIDDAEKWQAAFDSPLGTEELPLNTSPAQVSSPAAMTLAVMRKLSDSYAPPTPRFIDLANTADAPQAAIDRHLLLANRPQLPETFRQIPGDSQVIEADLRDRVATLSEWLGGDEVPDGAVVRLTGVGLVELPPLRFDDKRLTLEFVQGTGAPLVLRPGSGGNAEASIVVNGGRLDVVNANLQATPSPTRETPPRLLRVNGGEFSIRNSLIAGSFAGEQRDAPLIEWTGQASGPGRLHAAILDTQIIGQQPLIAANVDQRLLVIDNCVLGSGVDCVELRSQVGAAEVSRPQEGWVLLDSNTFLTGRNALRFTGLSAGRQRPAVRVIAHENVFSITPGVDGSRASVATLPGGMTGGNLFDWWEQRNAYAEQFERFRGSADGGGAKQSLQQHWVDFWGREHVQQPVAGRSAVLFANVLTSLAALEPRLVTINAASTANKSASDGGPLGARIDRVGPLGGKGTATPATGGKPAGTPSGRPDF
ncbi:MAG: serine/threonine-protein kinase [Planctomycetaceae bacterium]